jgi:hypothetical protein
MNPKAAETGWVGRKTPFYFLISNFLFKAFFLGAVRDPFLKGTLSDGMGDLLPLGGRETTAFFAPSLGLESN